MLPLPPLLFYVDLPRRISTIFRANDRPSPLLSEPETRLANLTLGCSLSSSDILSISIKANWVSKRLTLRPDPFIKGVT